MNIQIVISGDGWVLDKHAEILADGLGADIRTEPIGGRYDITYLMNYAQIRKLTIKNPNVRPAREYGKIVSMLTHYEEGMCEWWDIACEMSHALSPMSEATRNQIPPAFANKSTIIPLPVPNYITQRRPRIGIAGIRNAANEYRKGWDLVDRLRNDHPEWEIVTTGGTLSEVEMLAWYRSLDLYLCPSRYEGGPMGVIEAHAMGISLIVPRDVGWCNMMIGSYCYQSGKYEDMERSVSFAVEGVKRSATGEKVYIQAHRELFESLMVAS